MHENQVPYFVCTLGRAQKVGRHQYLSLNHLVDSQAAHAPDAAVLGMSVPREGAWGCQTLSWRNLRDASILLAQHFTNNDILPCRCVEDGSREMTVALLCPSSLDFAVFVFAAMRMGLGVLLIAPQSTPAAVAHLCTSTKATHLVYDASLHALATDARSIIGSERLSLVALPVSSTWDPAGRDIVPMSRALSPAAESAMTCIIYHSSGTTSGLPKPLPQAHRTMTALHPHIPGSPAVFSTTPLYHGGFADVVRSLVSAAMIYLFPASVPITRDNILRSLHACASSNAAQQDSSRNTIAYLSCVPYVLTMLSHEADVEASKILQSLSMVGVGGAPLPRSLGDSLVKRGVNLVSRYGSAECGFLMSSFRDFEHDSAWDYLRDDSDNLLKFEAQEGDADVAELVVSSEWPCITKVNRSDGSFATGDLYSRHPDIQNAWRYLGRRDDMLVLINGKKVDPIPLETALITLPDVADVVVFGANRPFIGVLVVPSVGTSESVLNEIRAVVASNNAQVSSHARVMQEMIVLLPSGSTFPRTPKGTIQRTMVYSQHDALIVNAYEAFESGGNDKEKTRIEDLDSMIAHIMTVVVEVVASEKGGYATRKPLDADTDLFAVGVDSIQAARIRGRLQTELELGQELRPNVVFEYPSVRSLAEHLLPTGTGALDGAEGDNNELVRMMDLVNKYGTFKTCKARMPAPSIVERKHVLLLTGATGALGAHLLDQAIQADDVEEVICLVRARDDHHARERVNDSLTRRHLPTLSDHLHVKCLAAELGKSDFALGSDAYTSLARRITLIIHAAWAVNFIGGLRSFENDHIGGVQNLINLSLRVGIPEPDTPAKFAFCSSGATVLGTPPASGSYSEEVPVSPESAARMGYACSKWVAERICARAHVAGANICILRIGQLCGDSRAGVWSMNEGWPLMLRTVDEVGCLPALPGDVSWLPVDVAAAAIMEIVRVETSTSRECLVYHVMNPVLTPWTDVLEWLKQYGKQFNVLSPSDWLLKVEESEPNLQKNPSRKLLGLWQLSYGQKSTPTPEPLFDTSRALGASASLKEAYFDNTLFKDILDHWCTSGFMVPPS